jgi:hypothetical protein
VNLDYPRDVHDPFADTNPEKLAEYRAWAHRALDTLLDYRLAWEATRRADSAFQYGQHAAAETDEGARDLHSNTLMFATKIIGRRATELNAEMFDEGDLPGMRAALRRIIRKVQLVWPTQGIAVSDFTVRRPILPRDLENALKDLDVGHTPDLFVKAKGRETDVLKERCRFAGALWSLHLEAVGAPDFTAQVVNAFALGNDGAKTVQRWKNALKDDDGYAQKLGHDHASHVTHLIARATLVDCHDHITGFPPYLVFNLFGQLVPSLLTLKGIGELYQSLLAKAQ